LIIQVPTVFRAGFGYRPIINLSSKKLRRIVHLIIPRMIGQASNQINLVVITAIASTLAAGSLSVFNFSDHLQAFPVRVIGLSFAVAAFPRFSKSLANGETKIFLDNFSNSVRKIVFAIVPISFLTFIMRGQIVRLVLGTGEFGWEDTRLTAAALGIFSFSLVANALVHLLVRAYFSMQDTKTPLYVSIGSVILNISLSLIFIFVLKSTDFLHSGLTYFLRLENLSNIEVLAFPLAFLFSITAQFLILYLLLEKRIGDLRRQEIIDSAIRVLGSSIVMTIVAFFSLRAMVNLVTLDTFLNVLAQFSVTLFFSIIAYLLAAVIFDSPEMKAILKKIL